MFSVTHSRNPTSGSGMGMGHLTSLTSRSLLNFLLDLISLQAVVTAEMLWRYRSRRMRYKSVHLSTLTDRQTDRQTETERQTDRQTNKQTGRQTDRHTHNTHTHTHTQNHSRVEALQPPLQTSLSTAYTPVSRAASSRHSSGMDERTDEWMEDEVFPLPNVLWLCYTRATYHYSKLLRFTQIRQLVSICSQLHHL